MSSRIKEKVRLYVAFRSGGLCAHPDCQARLTEEPAGDDEGVIIGEAAHIYGEKPGSARHDPEKKPDFLNGAENLIYLCPTHHTLIDKQPETYSVEVLFRWKSKHEMKMREATSEGSVEIIYSELQRATESPSSQALLKEVQDARNSEEYRASTLNGLGEKRDTLTPMLADFGDVDDEVRRRILGYSRWYEPANKAEVFEKLAMFGHEQGLIEINAQRLQEADLIQITENHYLPQNEEICQQAAESLLDEILQDLEE